MKKFIAILLSFLLLFGVAACCAAPSEDASATVSKTASTGTDASEEAPSEPVADGRDRPSVCGRLRVLDGKLCDASGRPVMLRGVSLNGLITSESFLNAPLFQELARDDGVNLMRLPMYTYGVGIIGYCTKGDKERHKQDVAKGVSLAVASDLYVIIDWHILSDGDPNTYADEAAAFFAEMAAQYADCPNVLYEICNEPNGVDWPTVKRYAERIIPVIREKAPDAVILVGNPDWSKDLDSVAADPLDFDNLLYSLHFYSATHGQEYREMTARVSQAGLPVFVTEFGVTAASGGLPRDTESADAWIELLEQENVSYCMWAFSNVAEACSAIKPSVSHYSGYSREDYTETGLWLLDTLARHK